MRTVTMTIPPSDHTTVVTATPCGICGAIAIAYDNTGTAAASMEKYLEQLGWVDLPSGTTVCNRCKQLPDVANMILAASKAKTQ